MNQHRPGTIVGGLLLLILSARLFAADLSTARTLYASASYEEALAMLSTIEAPDNSEQVNQIRGLCLLALGRMKEAEQSVERIVLQNPGYLVDNADVSPKFVTLFRVVRQRTLPTIARSLYAKAKTSYDEKHWVDAKAEFTRMLVLVDDPDLAEQRASLADLKQLGEGFLKLSEAELAVAAPPVIAAPQADTTPSSAVLGGVPAQGPAQVVPPPVVPSAVPTERSPASASPAPRSGQGAPGARNDDPRTQPPALSGSSVTIYTAQNQDVVPPVELQRPMPRWSPINRLVAQSTYRGLIELVIDERGVVESAAMVKSVTPMYDDLLLQSARGWRYSPAKRDGKPVRYRQVLEIVLRPSQEE